MEQQKISEKKIKTWGPNSTPYKKGKGRKERANFDRSISTENNTIQKEERAMSYPNLHKLHNNRANASDTNIAAKDPICKYDF